MTETIPKTCLNIPPEFKMDVVKILDLKSRFQLRKCSKTEKSIVDASSYQVETIALDFFTQPHFIWMAPSGSRYFPEIADHKLVIEDFIRLISHPKSTVGNVRLNFAKDSEELEYLMEKLSELNQTQPIKTRKFRWETRFNMDKLPDFLKFLCTKTLEEILFKHPPPLDLDLVNKIMETEQWKSVKYLRASYHLPRMMSLEDFVHADSFQVRLFGLTTPIFLGAVMKYIKRDPPPGSFFLIYADTSNLAQMDFLFYDPVPVGDKIPKCDQMLNYTMPTESNKLIICRSKKAIEGVVCRSDHLKEDFKLVRHSCTSVTNQENKVENQ